MVLQSPLETAVLFAGGIKYILLGAGAIVSVPVLVLVWRIGRDWGEQGQIIRSTGQSVAALTHPEKGVVARIAKQEYILTGDGGTNGVRGDVKRLQSTVEEMQTAQREQAESLHTSLGKREMAERAIVDRLDKLESRTTRKAPRRSA